MVVARDQTNQGMTMEREAARVFHRSEFRRLPRRMSFVVLAAALGVASFPLSPGRSRAQAALQPEVAVGSADIGGVVDEGGKEARPTVFEVQLRPDPLAHWARGCHSC